MFKVLKFYADYLSYKLCPDIHMIYGQGEGC